MHEGFDGRGGCRVTFNVPDDSPLLGKYGSRGAALVACREMILNDLSQLVDEFADEP